MRSIQLVVVFLFLFTGSFAQQKKKGNSLTDNWQERVFAGGGFGLGLTRTIDFISLSPIVGYMVTPRFTPGIGVTYRYTNYKVYTPPFNTSDYGFNIFARYSVYGPLFLQAQYEYLNYEYPTSPTTSVRSGFNYFLAGGGLFQPLGKRAGLFAMALYNFNYDPADVNSPYASPLILRVGISGGFFTGM